MLLVGPTSCECIYQFQNSKGSEENRTSLVSKLKFYTGQYLFYVA